MVLRTIISTRAGETLGLRPGLGASFSMPAAPREAATPRSSFKLLSLFRAQSNRWCDSHVLPPTIADVRTAYKLYYL